MDPHRPDAETEGTHDLFVRLALNQKPQHIQLARRESHQHIYGEWLSLISPRRVCGLEQDIGKGRRNMYASLQNTPDRLGKFIDAKAFREIAMDASVESSKDIAPPPRR